jgi:hypothetical protein
MSWDDFLTEQGKAHDAMYGKKELAGSLLEAALQVKRVSFSRSSRFSPIC